MKKIKPRITGALIYFCIFSIFYFFGSMPVPPSFPWAGFAWIVFWPTLFFCAFVLQTFDNRSLKQLSLGLFLFYLSGTVWDWVMSRTASSGQLLCFRSVEISCLVVMWVVAACGLLAAKWLLRKWSPKKVRLVLFRVVAVIFCLCLVGPAIDFLTVLRSGRQSAALTPPALKCDVDALKQTKVVPELHVPITGETNLIWCAPFQLAWNEMSDFVGEEIRFAENEPESVSALNQRLVDEQHLDAETFFATAGEYTTNLVRDLNAELKSRFGSNFKSESTDGCGPDRIAAFGYLSVNLPFKHAFQRDDKPLIFKGVPVEAFTLPFGEGSHVREERAKQQVRVCYPPVEGEFIVELKTREEDHHLILAKVAPEKTLAETVEKVCGDVDSLEFLFLETNQDLIVPLFNFDLTKEYQQFIGQTLALESSEYNGWRVEKAGQNIRFQLDERGAVLRSSAYMMCVFCAPPVNCIFDEPFLLMVRYKNSEHPYFAMWVDNAEILVKASDVDATPSSRSFQDW